MPHPNGYLYRGTITIDKTKCGGGGAISNFPMLFPGGVAFATEGNGGCCKSSSGYDVVFATDPAGRNTLAFELVAGVYNAVTGAGEWWVKTDIDSAIDTVIYVFAGNPNISASQANATAVWDGNFKGVFHFGDGTTTNGNDSTGEWTPTTLGSPLAVAGSVGGGAQFTTSDYWDENRGSAITRPLTIEFSYLHPSLSGESFLATVPYNNNLLIYDRYLGGATPHELAFFVSGSDEFTLPAVIDSSYHRAVFTVDGSGGRLGYMDGVSQTLIYSAGTTSNPTLGTLAVLGKSTFTPYNGKLDEVRFSTTVRSAAWLLADYNTQSAPTTFAALSVLRAAMDPYTHGGRPRPFAPGVPR